MISRSELNNFERKVMNAERVSMRGSLSAGVVTIEAREARELVEYVQWLERAVFVAGERAALAGDSTFQADLFSVIA